MSPVFAARRRAEEFNSLVEGTSTRELHDARTMELAELVGSLRSTAPVRARPEFVADLRERLMAEAVTALSATSGDVDRRLTVTPRRTPRERRIAAAVGGFAIVGATTSMAMAAQSALPGDTLYPLKRAIENAQTGFSVGDDQKGSTLLANASGRLDEVEALSQEEGSTDAETIALTLAEFTAQASAASELLIAAYEADGEADAIAELRDFTGASMEALAQLESVLPDGARAALIQAAQLLTQIDAEAAALCSVCGGEGISVIPPFAVRAVEDVLGGVAGAVTHPVELASGRGTVATVDGEDRRGGSKDRGRGGKGDGSGSGSASEPSVTTAPPPTTPGGGSTGQPGPTGQPSTIGDAVGGVLGGATGTGPSTTTSTPSTLPEDAEGVVGGVGEAVGDLLQQPSGSTKP